MHIYRNISEDIDHRAQYMIIWSYQHNVMGYLRAGRNRSSGGECPKQKNVRKLYWSKSYEGRELVPPPPTQLSISVVCAHPFVSIHLLGLIARWSKNVNGVDGMKGEYRTTGADAMIMEGDEGRPEVLRKQFLCERGRTADTQTSLALADDNRHTQLTTHTDWVTWTHWVGCNHNNVLTTRLCSSMMANIMAVRNK